MKNIGYVIIGCSLFIAACGKGGGVLANQLATGLDGEGTSQNNPATTVEVETGESVTAGAKQLVLPDVGACQATFACSALRSNFLGSWVLATPPEEVLPETSTESDETKTKLGKHKKFKKPDLLYTAMQGVDKPQCTPYGVRKGFKCELDTGEMLTCKKMHKYRHHNKHMKKHPGKMSEHSGKEASKKKYTGGKPKKRGYACWKADSE